MRGAGAIVALLALACERPRPPAPPPPEPALLPFPPQPIVDPVPSLEREVARLTDIAERLSRVNAELSRIEPRAQRLRSVQAASRTRQDVLRALGLALVDGPKGIRLTEVTGRGGFWTVSGVLAQSELLTDLVRLLRRSLHMTHVELPTPPPGHENWEFMFSFHFPEPDAPPGGPTEPAAPDLTSTRQKKLQLAIAELKTRADTVALFAGERRLADLTREVGELEARHLRRDEDAELESYALMNQATVAGIGTPAVRSGAVAMWHGLRARSFTLAGTGTLAAAADLARSVASTGAFVGNVTATIEPTKDTFLLEMVVNVALR